MSAGPEASREGGRGLVGLVKQAPPSGPDPYAVALQSAGWDVMLAEPLVVTFRESGPLSRALACPDAWAGLVLTSPRAALALARTGLPPGWHGQAVWTVGEETAREASRLGLRPRGAGSGSAEALARLIVEAQAGASGRAEAQPLLFPCGTRRRDALPQRLAEAGVPLAEVVVYASALRAGPLLPAGRAPEAVCFFSPSGVQAACADAAFPWKNARRLALGPATAEALALSGRSAHAVAARPTPHALAEALAEGGT